MNPDKTVGHRYRYNDSFLGPRNAKIENIESSIDCLSKSSQRNIISAVETGDTWISVALQGVMLG